MSEPVTDEKKSTSLGAELAAEFASCWQRLPNKAFFFTLLAAWLALFQFFGNSILGYVHSPSIFLWLQNAYQPAEVSTDDAHGKLIPFVVLGLFWWKRKTLLALPAQPWWPAFFIVVFAVLIHVVGYVVQQPRFSTAAMFIGIFGLMGIAWGRAWLKESLFPFWLFIFCVPLAAWLLPLTFPLRLTVSVLTEVASNLLGFDVQRVGTQLIGHGGKYQYDVVAACSGMKSLVSIFLLATVYGCLLFRSPVKRIFLMSLALPLSVLGNFLRLLCIIIASEFGGQEWGNYVHEGCPFHLPLLGEVAVVNLLPYVPAFLGLFLAGRWLEKKFGKES